MAVRRKCIKAGKEKVGDSARISARQVGREREDRWGKAVRRRAARAGQERKIWERDKGTLQDEQKGGGERDMR